MNGKKETPVRIWVFKQSIDHICYIKKLHFI